MLQSNNRASCDHLKCFERCLFRDCSGFLPWTFDESYNENLSHHTYLLFGLESLGPLFQTSKLQISELWKLSYFESHFQMATFSTKCHRLHFVLEISLGALHQTILFLQINMAQDSLLLKFKEWTRASFLENSLWIWLVTRLFRISWTMTPFYLHCPLAISTMSSLIHCDLLYLILCPQFYWYRFWVLWFFYPCLQFNSSN